MKFSAQIFIMLVGVFCLQSIGIEASSDCSGSWNEPTSFASGCNSSTLTPTEVLSESAGPLAGTGFVDTPTFNSCAQGCNRTYWWNTNSNKVDGVGYTNCVNNCIASVDNLTLPLFGTVHLNYCGAKSFFEKTVGCYH